MRSILPSRMRGEALETHTLLMLNLFDQLLESHLACWDSSAKKLLEELCAAQSSDLSSSLLREEPLRVPLNTGCNPHLPCELFGGQMKRGESALRYLVTDGGHKDSAISFSRTDYRRQDRS